MKRIKLFGKDIPKLGIGTWGIGGYMTQSQYSDYINEITQLKYQLSKGLMLIDCWIAQGEGNSLNLIRQAIEDFNRDNYILLCKFDIHKYSSIEDLEIVLDKYLDQLRVEYIDVFQIHKPDFSTISEKQIDAFLKKNKSIGKIKYFAVSNANISDIKKIQDKISVKLEANEILYNLFERGYEIDGTIDYCIKNNIKIISYRPLNRGMVNTIHTHPGIFPILQKYKITSSQLAINWILTKENFLALVKSVNRSHLNENLDCMRIELTNEETKILDSYRYIN